MRVTTCETTKIETETRAQLRDQDEEALAAGRAHHGRVATADVRRQTEGTKRRASTSRGSAGVDPRHDVTFREVSRSAVPSRTAEPTYLFGAFVVVVKCDLEPTYPDGATGDNGPLSGKEPEPRLFTCCVRDCSGLSC